MNSSKSKRWCRWGILMCLTTVVVVASACSDDDTVGDPAADAGGDVVSADIGGRDAGDRDTGDMRPDTGPSVDGRDQNDADIEIAGVYETNFDTVETVTNTSWTIASDDFATTESAIIRWDNDANYTITQNAADAEFSAGKFNKIVWTEPDGDGVFFYCTVDFGRDTAEGAEQTDATADDTDPLNSGCGASSWTQMTPEF